MLPRSLIGAIALAALVLTASRLGPAFALLIEFGLVPDYAYRILMSIGAVTASVLSIAVVRAGWRVAGAPALALFLSFLGVGAAWERSVDALIYGSSLPGLLALRVEQIGFNAVVLSAGALALLWFQRYPAAWTPHGSPDPSRARAWLEWMLPQRRVWVVFFVLPLIASSAWLWGAPIDATIVRFVVVILAGLTGAGYLRRQWRSTEDTRIRARAGWVVEALVLGVVLSAFALIFEFQLHVLGRSSPLVTWPHAVLLPIALIAFLGSLAISTFYRGAVTPELVINRTTVLGGLGLLLTCLFLVGEELLSSAVVEIFGLPSLFGAVITGVAAAVAFTPLYRWADGLSRGPRSGPAS